MRIHRLLPSLFVSIPVMLACPPAARAQAFVAPFIGYNFSGDATCQTASGCKEKNRNLGISFGTLNRLIAFEEEFAFAKNLFKETNSAESSVFTLMSNVVIGPDLGYVRPYMVGGFGLLKTQMKTVSLATLDNTDLGWDLGGGVMVLWNHIGVRGDIRYFHGVTDLRALGFPVSDLKLRFGRASVGLVLR